MVHERSLNSAYLLILLAPILTQAPSPPMPNPTLALALTLTRCTWRTHRSGNRTAALGIAICHQLLASMGGSIIAKSR